MPVKLNFRPNGRIIGITSGSTTSYALVDESIEALELHSHESNPKDCSSIHNSTPESEMLYMPSILPKEDVLGLSMDRFLEVMYIN